MANTSIMVRQEHLRNFPALAARLVGWRSDSLKDDAAWMAVLKDALEAECEVCGMRVTGEDLARLAKPVPNLPESPKVARLRLGYCARQGCDSYYYRLRFQPVSSVDWTVLLDGTGDSAVAPTPPREVEQPSDRLKAAAMDSVRRVLPRIAIGVLVIGALLFVRHWRRGGTVPLIREPEKFQVEVPPTGVSPNR
ncbi:MAG: hypothetical protein JNK85_02915 [Verrucomicrobiales bacterium]|nr:hypothetical protein [Verrucomicrobiales bacterium]